MNKNKYKRVCLKLSGEFLQGSSDNGIDLEAIDNLVAEINTIVKDYQLLIEIGAGNLYRWKDTNHDFSRNIADTSGMIASVINALHLYDRIQRNNKAKVVSAVPMPTVAGDLSPMKISSYLDNGYVVVAGGGTGHSYFTTDSGATLLALQNNCDVILKGTDVDGIFDDDPNTNPDAKKYDKITYKETIDKKLKIMDLTAFSLAEENKIPIIVFNATKKGNLKKILDGEKIGTLVV